jgi:hypothetical protein
VSWTISSASTRCRDQPVPKPSAPAIADKCAPAAGRPVSPPEAPNPSRRRATRCSRPCPARRQGPRSPADMQARTAPRPVACQALPRRAGPGSTPGPAPPVRSFLHGPEERNRQRRGVVLVDQRVAPRARIASQRSHTSGSIPRRATRHGRACGAPSARIVPLERTHANERRSSSRA